MSKEISDVKKYRWIRSERAGQIVEYHKVDEEWTYFTDKSRISNDLIEDYLEEVFVLKRQAIWKLEKTNEQP